MASDSAPTTSVVLLDRSDRGRLALNGKDRIALLQRLSTNDLDPLKPGEGTQTVLTNPIGRIIDLLITLILPDKSLIITNGGRSQMIADYLQGNIFFMDQVQIEDLSTKWGQLEIYGTGANQMLERTAGINLASLPLFAHQTTSIGSGEVRLARIKPLIGDGWVALAPQEQLNELRERLLAEGASVLGIEQANVLRIEAGLPGLPELNLEYIPLETGLWDAVSFSKGCYVGQEIIARMESRGRLAKRLMGLRLEELPATLPVHLKSGGKEAGDLTSAVVSPRHGPIGLGYVRSAFAEPGTTLEVEGRQATVVALPFIST